MTTLNEVELREIVQSDMKLWEKSDTQVDGTSVTKTLTLPYGIGDFSITFEGVHDAKTKRGAVEYWGEAVREAVNDVISDEAVEARAAQAAARNSERDGASDAESVPATDSPGVVRKEKQVDQAPDKGAEEAFTLLGASPADVASQLDSIRREQQRLRDRLLELEQQGRGLVAYLDAIGGVNERTSEETIIEELE